MAAKITLPPVAAEKQRLDKWLWFARVVKTRKQAVELIEAGYVRVDAQRIEAPAKLVAPGDGADHRARSPRSGFANHRARAAGAAVPICAEQLFEDLAVRGARLRQYRLGAVRQLLA